MFLLTLLSTPIASASRVDFYVDLGLVSISLASHVSFQTVLRRKQTQWQLLLL